MSQNKQILKHLKSGKTITPLQALDLYGCMRLSERIREINKQLDAEFPGYHSVVTEMVKQNGKRFARYRLI